MNDSEKLIKNSISYKPQACGMKSNRPQEYASMQKQYLGNRTRSFLNSRAYLSSDYVNADCQGLNAENFYEWINTNIRLADITEFNASTAKKQDDFKQVLFPELPIDYFPIGAKIKTMGSTWICINPSNLSSVNANALVGRCNTSYNSFDYYGNIITEPIIVEKYSMLGNDTDGNQNLELMDGYFNVTAQLNDTTAKLGENKRIILGDKPYHITGFTNFIQEFSGDRESVHLLNFTVRIGEPTENDDMINFVADGNSYKTSVEIHGQTALIAGQMAQFTPVFLINGQEVESTQEHPLSWQFSSSNDNIATINENGTVTAVAQGSAVITATLDQNIKLTATIELQITESITDDYVAFVGVVPQSIEQYQSATISGAFYQSGIETENPLNWSFSGASEEDFIATISENGKSATIECLSPSAEKLNVSISSGDNSAAVEISLDGY